MKRKHKARKKDHSKEFKKSLVTYVMMMIFFGFIFLRTGSSWVFLFIAIPMTISVLHKYIDASKDDEPAEKEETIYEDKYSEDDWDEEPLELEDMKTLRKEWKDSDFV